MLLVNLAWVILQSFLVITLLILAIGAVRLFVWGPFVRFEAPLRDIHLLRRGDIILTGKQSVSHSWYIQISNVLTRKLKHRFWTHAAIYQGNGKVWEAQPGGVIEKDLTVYFENGYILRAFRHRYVTSETELDRVIAFCASKRGFEFGRLGTIFYTLSTFIPLSFNWIFDNRHIDKLLHLDNAYYCSELIVDAFAEAGYPVSQYDGWRVKPSDFISNPFLEDIVKS